MKSATENKLLVIWQDNETRLRHIIGELSKCNGYKFRYSIEKIEKLKRFRNLAAFPELEKIYESERLFPTFSSRLPDKRRSDIKEILNCYEMDSYDEFELLKKSSGKLPTDSLEFIQPIDLNDIDIKRQFYIAGMKYQFDNCQEAILALKPRMLLSLQLDPDNLHDNNAVMILSHDNKIGYIPSYFSKEVTEAVNQERNVKVFVVEKKTVIDENWHELVKAEMIIM